MCKLTKLNKTGLHTDRTHDSTLQACDGSAESGATLIEYAVAFTVLVILWSGIAVYLNQRAIQRAEEGQAVGSAMGPYGIGSGGAIDSDLGTYNNEWQEPTSF